MPRAPGWRAVSNPIPCWLTYVAAPGAPTRAALRPLAELASHRGARGDVGRAEVASLEM